MISNEEIKQDYVERILNVSPKDWKGYTDAQKEQLANIAEQMDRQTEAIHDNLIQKVIYDVTGTPQHRKDNRKIDMYMDDLMRMTPAKDKNLAYDSANHILDAVTNQIIRAVISAYKAGIADANILPELTETIMDKEPNTTIVYDVLNTPKMPLG